jgi:hypothetical protein
MGTRLVYPIAGGEPKYYEQDGWIREMNGRAAFTIRGAEVDTMSGERAYVIRKNFLHRHDSGQPELFFGD